MRIETKGIAFDPAVIRTKAATSEPGAPAPILPQPSLASFALEGGLADQLAALMLQSAKEDRAAERAVRASAEAMQRTAEEKEVAAIRDKADDVMSKGVLEGAGTAVSGLLTLTGSVTKPGDAGMDAHLTMYKSLGGIAQGGVSIGAAFYDADGVRDDATAAEAKNAAGHAQSASGDAKAALDDTKALVSRVLDVYRQMQATENETRAAILHRT